MSWNDYEKPLKVWRLAMNLPETQGKQAVCIVAAKSRAAAARAFEVADGHLKMYGSETGNDLQILIASSSPGTLFWRPLNASVETPYVGRGLPPGKVADLMTTVGHFHAVKNAKFAGKSVWKRGRYTTRLILAGGLGPVRIEWEMRDGHKVVFGEHTLKQRFEKHDDAKRAGVEFARQQLKKALDSLPLEPLLEEQE